MSGPLVVAAQSNAANPVDAARELAAQASRKLQGTPLRGAIVNASASHDPAALQAALAAQLPGVPFIGATSCLGVPTAEGLLRGPAVAALFLAGDGFTFATAFSRTGTNPRATGEALADQVLGEVAAPRFALFSASPGAEEELLAGVVAKLPHGIPTLGGSAADDDLSGRWGVWSNEGSAREGAVLAACDWPWRFATNYQGGYITTDLRGTVTAAEGRTVLSIDGRPAAEVYNAWSGGKIAEELHKGGNVLAKTTLSPLGLVRKIGTAELYLLAHPERVDPRTGALSLFTQAQTGEEVVLMRSSPAALQQRGANVAHRALAWSKLTPKEVLGSIFVYCGGCILAIQDRADSMVRETSAALGGKPMVGHFAFGEQGCVWPSAPAEHGNLMASVLVLSGEPER